MTVEVSEASITCKLRDIIEVTETNKLHKGSNAADVGSLARVTKFVHMDAATLNAIKENLYSSTQGVIAVTPVTSDIIVIANKLAAAGVISAICAALMRRVP